ncbi:MAG: DUF934 domain-containing protein [Burkholderiaceae bacterium]
MSTLINATEIITDQWILFTGDAADVPVGSKVLLPIEEWLERTRVWQEHAGAVGILLEPTDDPARLKPWLDQIELVSIDFPKFTDGRGFSIARLLRSRLGFSGAIRAVGEIVADQVPMLQRCGFTEFETASDRQAEIALELLSILLPTYQPASDGIRTIPLPGERFDIASLATESATAQ